MKDSGAIVYWINSDYSVSSATISPSELRAGSTYDSEAEYKTGYAEHRVVIPISRSGMPAEKEALNQLKLKALEMNNSASINKNSV